VRAEAGRRDARDAGSQLPQLNAEYGFAFALQASAELDAFGELDLIDHNYSQYLGLLQVWRMASPGFMEQFRRMLTVQVAGGLRKCFGQRTRAVEPSASNQVDLQLARPPPRLQAAP
jgi:hypothetical protein